MSNHTVVTSHEPERGCGFRHPGLYLMGDLLLGEPCERLPMPIRPCESCLALGITCKLEQHRGHTWVNPHGLFASAIEPRCAPHMPGHHHHSCPACHPEIGPSKALMMWIGVEGYETADAFLAEAHRLGVSRRLPTVPNDLVPGETRVLLAHPRAVTRFDVGFDKALVPEGTPPAEWPGQPGIFTYFKVDRVDIVVHDPANLTEREKKLADRWGEGARLVHVIPQKPEQLGLDVGEVALP